MRVLSKWVNSVSSEIVQVFYTKLLFHAVCSGCVALIINELAAVGCLGVGETHLTVVSPAPSTEKEIQVAIIVSMSVA